MIENIKVTVTYEEKDSSKFDALAKEFVAAKALADATKATYEPLLECVGQAKLDCIYKQLETIVDHLRVISDFRGGTVAEVSGAKYDAHNVRHTVRIIYAPHASQVVTIYLDGNTEANDSWFEFYGIVTRWNEYNLYTKLEEQCERMVNSSIEVLKRNTDHLVDIYNKMVHD